jgi:hypothetical protein
MAWRQPWLPYHIHKGSPKVVRLVHPDALGASTFNAMHQGKVPLVLLHSFILFRVVFICGMSE